MNIIIRPITEVDLKSISIIRHHPETLSYLHTRRIFSLREMKDWLKTTSPKWLMVELDGAVVGYIRISDVDVENHSIKVGCDIHPNYRRKGIATRAYRLLFAKLRNDGFSRVWLEVLESNTKAINLYNKLGFIHEGHDVKRVDSWIMEKQLVITNINAKVIVVYIGHRRASPKTPQEAYQLLNFMLDKESSLDSGCPVDTIIVHNKDTMVTEETKIWVQKADILLKSADGCPTRNGKFILMERENIGLSFGAYNHAFLNNMLKYDYWFFTEDDQVIIKEGCFAHALRQMKADPHIGFVATVGVTTEVTHPPHAHGGVGITSRDILKEVMAQNITELYSQGQLPHHIGTDYSDHEVRGEICFSNEIHKLGYTLCNIDLNDICVSWGDLNKRTPRMVAWTPQMVQVLALGEP